MRPRQQQRTRKPLKKSLKDFPKNAQDETEEALIMVRLALERAKENASQSSSEVVSLRRQLHQMKSTQEHLESEVKTYRSHCIDWQRTAESQEKKIHKLLSRVQNSIKDRERFQLQEEQRIEVAAELAAVREDKKAEEIKNFEQLSTIKSLVTKARRHLNGSNNVVRELLDKILQEVGGRPGSSALLVDDSEDQQHTLQVETTQEERGVIPHYRMLIVKTRAKLKSVQTQLYQESRVTDKLRRQVAHFKAKLLDDDKSPCTCDDNEPTDVKQLELVISSQEKGNAQLRQKMVHQARMIEKMQSIIHNQQSQISSINYVRNTTSTSTNNENRPTKDRDDDDTSLLPEYYTKPLDVDDFSQSLKHLDEEIKRLS